MENDGWKRYIVNQYNPFYNIFTQVIKRATPEQSVIEIRATNQDRSNKLRQQMDELFRFVFEFQDDDKDVIGVEVFRKVLELDIAL